MNLTIRHYCESKVLNQKISTKHDMIYSYNAVYQIPRPRDTLADIVLKYYTEDLSHPQPSQTVKHSLGR